MSDGSAETIGSVTVGLLHVSDESGLQVDPQPLADLGVYLLDRLRLHPMCELSITAVDEVRMAQLHREWMDEAGPTDVLSFPMDELRTAPEGAEPQQGILGDIVVCPQVAAGQAAEAGRTLDQELALLVTHAMLHLIGYDHADEEELQQMFTLQDLLLADWLALQAQQSPPAHQTKGEG